MKCRYVYMIIGGVLFLTGSIIYLLFRKELPHLVMSNWIALLGCSNIISKIRQTTLQLSVCDFVVYCLPDGLFSASYIMVMESIWRTSNENTRLFFVLLMPTFCIAHELLQGLGLANGSYDIRDLLCYLLPILIYLYHINIKVIHKKNKSK